MRRNLTLFVALAVAALVLAGAGAGFVSSSSSPVTVSVSAVMDVDSSLVLIDNENAAENIITVPTEWVNLSVNTITIDNSADNDNLEFSLTVNSTAVIVDNILTAGTPITVTRQNLLDNGVENDTTIENIVFSSDNNAKITLTLTGVDNSFDAATMAYVESYVTEPEVKYESDESWFTAKDRVTITNASDFPVENVDASVTYSGFAISQDVTSYAIASLSAGASSSRDLTYQKGGPYVTTIHEPVAVADNKWKTEMKVYSHENLVNIVDFEFDPAVSPWVDYFPDFDFDTLTVTVNDASVTPKSASVLLEDFSLVAGPNTIAFTWTSVVPPPYVPPVVVPWWLVEFVGVPTWMWIVVCVFVVVILISLRPEIVRRKST